MTDLTSCFVVLKQISIQTFVIFVLFSSPVMCFLYDCQC